MARLLRMRQFLAALLALPLLSTLLAAQPARAPVIVSPADKDCMARVMIFESRQRDHNSLLAEGDAGPSRPPGTAAMCFGVQFWL